MNVELIRTVEILAEQLSLISKEKIKAKEEVETLKIRLDEKEIEIMRIREEMDIILNEKNPELTVVKKKVLNGKVRFNRTIMDLDPELFKEDMVCQLQTAYNTKGCASGTMFVVRVGIEIHVLDSYFFKDVIQWKQ